MIIVDSCSQNKQCDFWALVGCIVKEIESFLGDIYIYIYIYIYNYG